MCTMLIKLNPSPKDYCGIVIKCGLNFHALSLFFISLFFFYVYIKSKGSVTTTVMGFKHGWEFRKILENWAPKIYMISKI